MTTDLIPTEADLDRMEHELFSRIDREERIARTTHRHRGWLATASVAAAALVVTSVLSNGFGLIGSAGATASASEVLERASANVASSSAPTVGENQYLEVLLRENAQTSEIPDNHASEVWWMQMQTVAVFYSADSSIGPTEARVSSDPTDIHGNAAGRQALATQWAASASRIATVSNDSSVVRFWSQLRTDISSLPTSQDGVHSYLYRVGRNDSGAWQRAEELLSSGLLSDSQRAMLYLAIEEIPGVDVTQRQANLDGQEGTALGRSEENGLRDEIIVDDTTGQFLGNRTVVVTPNTAPNAPHQAAGTVVRWSALHTDVVSSIPTAEAFTSTYGSAR